MLFAESIQIQNTYVVCMSLFVNVPHYWSMIYMQYQAQWISSSLLEQFIAVSSTVTED